eukprot:COSAG02_NODE_90_length_37755_cov_29.833364_38_plen_1386_part_00
MSGLTPCVSCDLGFFGPGGEANCSSCTPASGSCTITSCDHPATADTDYDPATPCTTCGRGMHPPASSTECGLEDHCYDSNADCLEAHPSAVCALPVYDPDDNDALLALPDARLRLQLLSFTSCRDCACLATNSLCDELRRGLPGLDGACRTSCAAPRPAEERGCVTASLPGRMWREVGRVDTPANEYASVRPVCEAGLQAVVNRTAAWLVLAANYQLQAVESNAGVIATQLCHERRYESLACLDSSSEFGVVFNVSSEFARPAVSMCEDDPEFLDAFYNNPCSMYTEGGQGSMHAFCDRDADVSGRLATVACPVACGSCAPQDVSSPAAVLGDLHDQACAMAESIGKGRSIDTLLSTTDVPPLTFTSYHDTFRSVQSYGNTLLQSLDNERALEQLQTTLSQTVDLSAVDAVDEQNLWQNKVDAEQDRMDVYRTQILGIDAMIQQTLQTMQLDGPALIESVTGQLAVSRQNFRSAVSAAALRSEERAVLERSISDIARQTLSLQQQIAGLGTDQQRDRQRLEHRLQSLTQQQALAQQRLNDDDEASAVLAGAPTCSASCAGPVQPSSNGCGNDFTGQFHSWGMTALEWVTGCPAVSDLMNDMEPCCDAHDICYGTCGMTQAFCDQQLRNCMQSQASLPSCQTSIDASSLIVQLLGCDHFTATQEESVAAQCLSTDPNHGCIGSCRDEGTCLQAAEQICDTVGSIAAAITANPIGNAACTAVDVATGFLGAPGACHAVLAVAQEASYGLSVIEEAWDVVGSFLGRRLQSCGDMDPAACLAMQQRVTTLQDKVQSAKRLVATASSLAALNTQLLSPEEIDPASLVKLDMSFLDLNMLNDQVLVGTFSSALGGNAAMYETEVHQVVTLIRSKLEQTRAYYQAALLKQTNEQQRDLLGRRAHRATQLISEQSDSAAQLAITQDFLDAKLRAYSHIGLQYVIKEARAYEYLFLQPYTGLDLDRLRSASMTGREYFDFVVQAETDLQSAFSRTASRNNNGGSSTFASTVFELAALPAAQPHFVRTGKITLSIALPEESNYYGVTFSDVRAFLVGLSATEHNWVTIDLIKKGTSVFQDASGNTHRFTHDESTPSFVCIYDARSCTPHSTSDPRLQSGNMEDIYTRYSPYGTWSIQVQDGLSLSSVTAIRFEFALQAQAGAFDGSRIFFEGGSLGELGAAACTSLPHETFLSPPPLAPPPPPLPAPPPPSSGYSQPPPSPVVDPRTINTGSGGSNNTGSGGSAEGSEDEMVLYYAAAMTAVLLLLAISTCLRVLKRRCGIKSQPEEEPREPEQASNAAQDEKPCEQTSNESQETSNPIAGASLPARASRIHQFLADIDLLGYEATLAELGMTDVSHVTDVVAEDLSEFMKPLEVRRFLKAAQQWELANGTITCL